jgi:cellulose synthase/poly-beta-1,6-N-acetylglucosamine synthase-like glycosyltransferase
MASGAGYALLILLLSFGWFRLRKVVSTGVMVTDLSVIIPIRNEADNIQRLIKLLSTQDYPEKHCEIILVNDHSSDGSMKEIQAHASSPLFRVLDLPEGKHGKKNAIQHGIANASGRLIITMDADCHPGKQWLRTMAAYYDNGRYKMLAAPLAVENPKGITARFQALEFLSLIGSGAGAIGTGIPIMCNGANLAYEKNAFEEVEGFKGNEHIPGGDDVFLLEKFSRHFGRQSIAFVKDRKALVYTRPSKGPVAFIRQRIRWVAKSPSYRDPFMIASAIIVLLFNLLLLLALIVGIYSTLILQAFITALAFKCIVDFPLMWKVSSFAKQRGLMLFYLPFQLFYFIFISLAGILGNLFSYQWKGRKH